MKSVKTFCDASNQPHEQLMRHLGHSETYQCLLSDSLKKNLT